MFENGFLTMKNYGNRRNCTVSIIYPSKIQGVNVDIGVTAEQPVVEAEIGLTDKVVLHRGSYMSPHVLLNLLNELGKRDKMRGLPSILSLFRNEFNKFNNTRARMLDSIYHMTNTLKSHFWRKNVIILSLYATLLWTS